MKQPLALTVTSLLSILLASIHIADDVVRGYEPGGTSNYNAILILAVALYGTLALAGRRAGYVIMLLMAIGAAAVPYIHMGGRGLMGPRVAGIGNELLWVWTLLAMGTTGIVGALLASQALWSSFRARPQ